MRIIHVRPAPPSEMGDWIRFAARLERPDLPPQDLWFDVPKAWAPSVSTSADAFAIATFFLGGIDRAPLHIHGTVSPSLLRNLEEVSLMWSLWRPGKYAPTSLTADLETEAPPGETEEAIACFSGGVDGSFTAYRHSQGLCGRQRRKLGAGLLIQGCDIRLDEPEQFSRASLQAQKSLADLQLPLVNMRTNVREIGVDWEEGFGSVMAAALSLLKGRFRQGLVGSCSRYDFFQPYGSTPLVDPLFSSDNFRVIHDGGGFSRTQKVRVVNQWAVGAANLRVCWAGADPSRNCGRCEKCIRTILNFRAVGAGLPSCFKSDVSDEDIASMRVPSDAHLNELLDVLEEAKKSGLQDEQWVVVLARRIARARRGPSLAQRWKASLSPRTRLRTLYRHLKGKEACAS